MEGAFSTGEFGGVLGSVFKPEAKADFQWKETAALAGGNVEVFNYRVARQNSGFTVTGSDNRIVTVGFHGLVYIDPATHSVRRITLVADDLAKDFTVHATTIGVDYDYVVINAHDYLMPIGAEFTMKKSGRQAIMNTLEFRDYRRFGSTVRIVGGATEKKQ